MKPETNGHKKIVFEEYSLEGETQTIWRGSEEIHLPKRPFQVLSFLIENRERVVGRDELLEKFWNGHDVYDDALRKCVGSIRKVLKDTERPPRFIETRYGSGYRFVAEVKELAKNGNGSSNGLVQTSASTSINFPDSPVYAGNSLPKLTKPESQSSTAKFAAVGVVAVVLLLSLGIYLYTPLEKYAGSTASSLDSAITPIRSIAVMPMKNLTGESNDDYFSDGLTESIITELSRVNGLKVISRSSTFTFKDKDIDPREIGTSLGVDALLEGSVQRKGDIISVKVRLVSTRDGSVVWTSNDFERPIAITFDLQDAIACNLASELRTALCGSTVTGKTKDGLAYQEYLKGRYEWNKRTGDGIKKSIEHYKRSIQFDPDYSLAYAGLADSYIQGIWLVPFATDFALPKGLDAAKKAIELDDSSAEAHSAMASAYQLDWKWEDAERELQRAIELDPNYARAHHVYAFHLSSLGRYDEALASIYRARDLDPLNVVISSDIAMILLTGSHIDAGRIDRALEQCLKVVETNPNYAQIHGYLTIIYLLKNMPDKAAVSYLEAKKLEGASTELLNAYNRAFRDNGIKGIFRKELNDMLARQRNGVRQSATRNALFYALLGEKKESLKWLEKAVEEHDAEIVAVLTHPSFDVFRSEPEFANLQKRIGL